MTATGVQDVIDGSELLMRRVPAVYFDSLKLPLSPMGVVSLAFKPRSDEAEGISLSRLHSPLRPDFLTIETLAALASRGKQPEKRLYIAILSASELTDPNGLALPIIPDPTPDDPGHSLVPRLNSKLASLDRDNLTIPLARDRCIRVVGPFNCNGPIAGDYVDWLRPSAP